MTKQRINLIEERDLIFAVQAAARRWAAIVEWLDRSKAGNLDRVEVSFKFGSDLPGYETLSDALSDQVSERLPELLKVIKHDAEAAVDKARRALREYYATHE